MTKVIILGEDTPKEKKKPIEFEWAISADGESDNASSYPKPKDWENIELVCRSYTEDGKDLMFAYNEDRNHSTSVIYLGYFNDGVVE